MDADTWASLLHDLLVEILRRLTATAVVRCARVCKPWRRAIITNASCLRPRADRFNPNLLIGFFYRYWHNGTHLARLQYVPGPFENALAMGAADDTSPLYMSGDPYHSTISFFMPWAASHVGDFTQYDVPLSSRDGFLLLRGGSGSKASDLCLCNPLSGTCRFIPAATLGAFKTCTYVLVTDDGGGAGDLSSAVWILAVRREDDVTLGVIYQIFSPSSGEWGEVKRSAKFEKGWTMVNMRGVPNDMVVHQGSVYWIVRLFADGRRGRIAQRCVFAIDVRTERTWTIELPKKRKVQDTYTCNRLVLATSTDSRLSLILQLRDHKIEVWVHVGNGEWTLRRAIDLHSLIPGCLNEGEIWLIISGFCPRSGCLFGDIGQEDLLIDVDKGCLRPTGRVGVNREAKYAYEMDWSTYLSKMKYF